MFRRRFAATALVAFGMASWSVQDAAAQERLDVAKLDFASSILNNTAVPAFRLADVEQMTVPVQMPRIGQGRPSALLTSLYASTAMMQALDVHSTLKAFNAGAVEGNPLMSGIASHRGAFIAMKTAVAASTILAVRQIAKRSKVAAVVTSVAINSAYAMVVRHNYNVARGR